MIKLNGYHPDVFNIGIYNPEYLRTFSCREEFFNETQYNNISNGLIFRHENGADEKFRKLITLVEDILNLKDKSIISETNFKDVVHIKLGKFWTRYLHRVHFFTALMKTYLITDNGGFGSMSIMQDFNDKNTLIKYMENVYNNKYFCLGATHTAFKLFLDGYRIPTKKWYFNKNWQETFSNKDEDEIKELLQKPKSFK